MALHLTKTDKDKYKDKHINQRQIQRQTHKPKTKTKTKYIKDPTCAILKSRGFKEIKYDIHRPNRTRPDQTTMTTTIMTMTIMTTTTMTTMIPPFGNYPKIHRVWSERSSLTVHRMRWVGLRLGGSLAHG